MATRIKKVERSGSVGWCRLGNMRVSPAAQREMVRSKVDQLLSSFDLDSIGIPIVNNRDGHFYIIDGQHRIEALKDWMGDGWEDQQVQCHVYEGLTEAEEAEKFLQHNNSKAVSTFDKFRVGVTAKLDEQVKITRILEAEKLHVSREKKPGAVSAVGTLQRIYRRSGGDETLQRTLRICRDAYHDVCIDSAVIDGVGYLCQRYNGTLKESAAVKALSETRGGTRGLLQKAEQLRVQFGGSKGHCVAAAVVREINNRKARGEKKLPDWFAI